MVAASQDEERQDDLSNANKSFIRNTGTISNLERHVSGGAPILRAYSLSPCIPSKACTRASDECVEKKNALSFYALNVVFSDVLGCAR